MADGPGSCPLCGAKIEEDLSGDELDSLAAHFPTCKATRTPPRTPG